MPAGPPGPGVDQPDLGKPATLLLVRHATTAHTGRDVTGGSGDTEPLDAAGLAQAAALASRLAAGPPATALVTSPLVRTRQPAGALAARLGLDPRPEQAGREIDSLDGASVPGLRRRVARARDGLLGAYPGGTVVVVTHAGPIKAVLAEALDAAPVALWRLRIDPASLSTVRYWADGGVEVAAVNDTSHLSSA